MLLSQLALITGSIKLLASTFSAFDHPIYQYLISRHLNDPFSLPKPILVHLQNGGFSVRLTGTELHGVVLDKCHEMQINRDAKLAVVRPSEQKMDYLSNYFPYCSTCLRNLNEQLFPPTNRATEELFAWWN